MLNQFTKAGVVSVLLLSSSAFAAPPAKSGGSSASEFPQSHGDGGGPYTATSEAKSNAQMHQESISNSQKISTNATAQSQMTQAKINESVANLGAAVQQGFRDAERRREEQQQAQRSNNDSNPASSRVDGYLTFEDGTRIPFHRYRPGEDSPRASTNPSGSTSPVPVSTPQQSAALQESQDLQRRADTLNQVKQDYSAQAQEAINDARVCRNAGLISAVAGVGDASQAILAANPLNKSITESLSATKAVVTLWNEDASGNEKASSANSLGKLWQENVGGAGAADKVVIHEGIGIALGAAEAYEKAKAGKLDEAVLETFKTFGPEPAKSAADLISAGKKIKEGVSGAIECQSLADRAGQDLINQVANVNRAQERLYDKSAVKAVESLPAASFISPTSSASPNAPAVSIPAAP